MSETTNQQVVNWARAQKGKQVRKGECWDLADAALRQAGAKSSADLGPMDEDADYVWGNSVSDLKDVQAGDILQFRDFTVTTTTETETRYADGSSTIDTTESSFTRPHHTAIVSEVMSGGQLKILEQNCRSRGQEGAAQQPQHQGCSGGVKGDAEAEVQGDRDHHHNGERNDLGLSSEEIVHVAAIGTGTERLHHGGELQRGGQLRGGPLFDPRSVRKDRVHRLYRMMR